MSIKIRRINDRDGRWVSLTPLTNVEGDEIKVRPLTQSIVQEIRRSVATPRLEPDPKTHRMVAVDHVDPQQFDDALTDYIIEEWRSKNGRAIFVDDTTGEPLPITLESKKRICDNTDLFDFIWNAAKSFELTTDREKNSGTP